MTGRGVWRRGSRFAVGILSSFVLVACGAVEFPPSAVPVNVVVPRPAGVADPAVVPSAGPEQEPDCDPYASLRPTVLPTPGDMPVGSPMHKIQERGRLVVGVSQSTPLFGFRNPSTGALEGFDIDMASEVARAIFGDPRRIQFRVIPPSLRVQVLEKGEVDLVASLLGITCSRKKSILFSADYFDSGTRAMARQDAAFSSLDELGGRRVCTLQGTTTQLAALDPKPVTVGASDWVDCLVMLQQRQVDAIVGTDSILVGLVAQDPATKLIGSPVDDQPHGLGVALSNPDFVRFVNGVLEQLVDDGTWQASYDRWLAAGLGPDTPPVARYTD